MVPIEVLEKIFQFLEEYETEDEEKVEYGKVRCNRNTKDENNLKTKESDQVFSL